MFKERLSMFKELWQYARERRQIIIFLLMIFFVLLGILVTLAGNPVLAPFIYPLF